MRSKTQAPAPQVEPLRKFGAAQVTQEFGPQAEQVALRCDFWWCLGLRQLIRDGAVSAAAPTPRAGTAAGRDFFKRARNSPCSAAAQHAHQEDVHAAQMRLAGLVWAKVPEGQFAGNTGWRGWGRADACGPRQSEDTSTCANGAAAVSKQAAIHRAGAHRISSLPFSSRHSRKRCRFWRRCRYCTPWGTCRCGWRCRRTCRPGRSQLFGCEGV